MVVNTFRCVPLTAIVTRASCAARHERAVREERGGLAAKGRQQLPGGRRCASCTLGAQHLRGLEPLSWPALAIPDPDWPSEGTPLELGLLRVYDGPPRPEECSQGVAAPPPHATAGGTPRASKAQRKERTR